MSLRDALQFIDESKSLGQESRPSRIFVELPEVASSSEDESDNENEVAENVSSKQLKLGCEMVLRNGKRFGSDVVNNRYDESSESEETLSDYVSEPKSKSLLKTVSTSKSKPVPSVKCTTKSFSWINDSSNPMIQIFPMPNYIDCDNISPHEQFEKFIDQAILELILKESAKYAAYRCKPDPKISIDELKVYIGILIVSGYSIQSRFESYWSSDPDLRNELIYSSMRKNRFKEISQFLHFADMNEPSPDDKMWKLRPLTDRLKANILKHFHPEQELSYDESMIEYYGRHAMKQYLKEKPVPFGFKVWSLCTRHGYLVNFEVYQGRNPRSKTVHEESFGKCIAPLFDMIEDFEPDVRALPFSFYFDNLFTGFRALIHLKSLGYNGTGTIRENRLTESCPLKQKKKETKKLGRGFMTSKSIKDEDIHLTKWVDNAVVSVASTLYGIQPKTVVQRYSSIEKKRVDVPCPLVVAKYNKNMGGVDRMDQNISLYRIGIHGKKWWYGIFTWLIDVSLQNSWQLHRVAHPEMTHLDFRRAIALFYCRHFGTPPKSTGNRKRKFDEAASSLRYDLKAHFVRPVIKKRRCAGESCKTIGRTICGKCDVGLCVHCFEKYHLLVKYKIE